MKILFLTRMYPNQYKPRDGAVIYRQANELTKLGHEVVVVSPVPSAPILIKNLKSKWLEYSKLPIKVKENNINIYRPRYINVPTMIFERYNLKSIQASILSIVGNIHTDFKFDLIHAHMGYPEGEVAIKLKEIYNVPIVTTLRSTDTDVHINNKEIYSHLKNTLNKSDIVISPSVPLKRKTNSIVDREIRVIGNGTDPSSKVKLDQNLKKIYKEKKVLLSVSRLTKDKGIASNIKAINELIPKIPNIYYIILGDGPERVDLEKLVKDLKIQDYIEFKGDLPHKEAMRYMSICDIFSLPSLIETFGLVYIEAMLNKKPVILCENVGIEGTVIHKKSGMVIKKNSLEELVNAIYYLFTNKEDSNKIALKGQEIVVENFLWEQIGKEIESVYKEAISKQCDEQLKKNLI